MIKYLIPILILITKLAFAQESITITGKVQCKTTNIPLCNASVGIYRNNIGTITNEKGEFWFRIPEGYSNDSLFISMLGYEAFVAPIEIFKNTSIYYLNIEPIEINEVEIRERRISAWQILKKMEDNIEKNYSCEPYSVIGFYRQYLKYDSLYKRATEAAFSIYDVGMQKEYDYDGLAPFVSIDGLIKSKDYRTGWDTVDHECNGIARLWYLHRDVKGLEGMLQRIKYKCSIDSVIWFENQWVYVINCSLRKGEKLEFDASSWTTSTPGKKLFLASFPVAIEGIIDESIFYIACSNYSLLWKRHYRDYSKSNWPDLGNVTKRQNYYDEISYQYFGNKLFPKNIIHSNSFIVYGETKTDTVVTVDFYRELFINNIETNIKENIQFEKLFNKRDIHNLDIEYDSIFWNEYKYFVDDSLRRKVTADFKKQEQLK